MRKLISIATTGLALAKGVIALKSYLRSVKRDQAKAIASDALEIRTADGQTVIYKPVDEDGQCVDTVAEAAGTGDKDHKPHQEKPSRMGLAPETPA